MLPKLKSLSNNYGSNKRIGMTHSCLQMFTLMKRGAQSSISISQCYTLAGRPNVITLDLHVFCNASEWAKRAVAYLLSKYKEECHTSFVMSRFWVVPSRQLSVKWLEPCGSQSGAQLAQHLETELNITFHHTTLWTDSTIILKWLKSKSCHIKAFVGIRVAEIQELTDHQSWQYVDSSNPCGPIPA